MAKSKEKGNAESGMQAFKRKQEQWKQESHERYRKILKELVEITKDCRPSMHEPDEQGISARVVGNNLDNAFGNHLVMELIVSGGQEFVVILEREGNMSIPRVVKSFNLADLIALARTGDPKKIDY